MALYGPLRLLLAIQLAKEVHHGNDPSHAAFQASASVGCVSQFKPTARPHRFRLMAGLGAVLAYDISSPPLGLSV